MATTATTNTSETSVSGAASPTSANDSASPTTANPTEDLKMDWALARRVAVRIAGDEPLYRSYLAERLNNDFAQATPLAEKLVQAETRLTSDAGQAHAVVIDRATWIDANIRSFRRLLKPVLGPTSSADSSADSSAAGSSAEAADSANREQPFTAAMVQLMRKFGAVELGTVLGWMSRRVLGQYDLLLATDDEPAAGSNAVNAVATNQINDGDVVYYVGPNILTTEKRFAFPPSEFRLWLALHELTHRSQFTGVPWLRPYFLKLVTDLVEVSEPDAERIRSGLRSLIAERKAGRDPIGEGGLAALFATEQQRELIEKVSGMMSLIEGHGDATMARAAVGYVPSAERFHQVMHHRRKSGRGVSRLLQRLMGIEAKLKQYEAGESFIEAIEAERGDRAVDQIWQDPEYLPSLSEIRTPADWLERVPAALPSSQAQ